jgi:ABC-2 type transport system permease protein
MGVGIALFDVEVPDSVEKWVALGWLSVLGLTTWTLLGLAFSAVPKSGKGASAIVTPVILVLQFTSGVFFIYSELPSWMQQFAALFPLKWLTQGMRYVFLPDEASALEVTGSFEMPRVALVLGIWTVLSAILAWVFFRWRRRGDG